MLTRLYIHNFRCFDNFEFKLDGMPSSLLIGKNGTGKSTVAIALSVLQQIGRGVNRVGQLVSSRDFYCGHAKMPMRLEIEVKLEGKLYSYGLALELPEEFREMRVLEESLTVEGQAVFSREPAEVLMERKTDPKRSSVFSINRHLIALPIIQEQSLNDPINRFRRFLAHMAIIRLIPPLMQGDSNRETLEPESDLANFGNWLSGLLTLYPAAYTTINDYLRDVMPDFLDFQNQENAGRGMRRRRTYIMEASDAGP